MNALKKLHFSALSLSALLIAGGAFSASGWGDGGHMMVAKIAYDRLNPKAKAEADRLLQLRIAPASITEKSLSFIDASHWPDDIKPLSAYSYTAEYHYVDQPFTQDGTALPADLPKEENALKAMDGFLAALQNGTDEQKAEALRWIIHLTGDLHQPLHCATRVSAKLPEGDRGGNDLSVSVKDASGHSRSIKLHSFWDEGLETFPKMGAHFQPPSDDQVIAAAAALVTKYPATDSGWMAGSPRDFDAWAKQGFDLASTQVYAGLKPHKAVSQEYFDRCTPIAERQVAWAGYRLAQLLNDVWPENPSLTMTGRAIPLKDDVILIIRHAEKPNHGKGLSDAGSQRADAYAQYFQSYMIGSIPCKLDCLVAAADSKRSERPRLTLEPLSHALNLTIVTNYQDKEVQPLADRLKADTKHHHILICWHHSKIPDLLEALGADPEQLLPGGEWPDSEFGWVIQLVYGPDGQLIPDQTKRIEEHLVATQ